MFLNFASGEIQLQKIVCLVAVNNLNLLAKKATVRMA